MGLLTAGVNDQGLLAGKVGAPKYWAYLIWVCVTF